VNRENLRSHDRSYVPNTKSFVPSSAGNPALRTKQAPVNTHNELCMSIHDSQLFTVRSDGWKSSWLLTHGCSICPNPACHIVATTQQNIAEMGAPCESPNSILMTPQQSNWSALWIADVKCTNDLVNTSSGNDGVSVLVPIMREYFIRCKGGTRSVDILSGHWRRTMNWDQVHQVVGGRCWSPQVEDS
jgi:hypothetical protein